MRFELMSWKEFDLRIRGYFLRLAREKWLLREMVWNLWAVNTPGDKFNLERKDIMILPWDEPETPRREFTREEIEEINERFNKALEK